MIAGREMGNEDGDRDINRGGAGRNGDPEAF
jgi:hypothetical protein